MIEPNHDHSQITNELGVSTIGQPNKPEYHEPLGTIHFQDPTINIKQVISLDDERMLNIEGNGDSSDFGIIPDELDGGPKVSEEYDPKGDSPAALYLREISRIPLLNAEQEIELAKHIETGKLATETLAEGVLSQEDREHFEEQIRIGEEARKKLTEANLRLVVSVARKYLGRGLQFLDLIQEGNIGLQRGVEKYDYGKGFRFSTYAYWWIRQAISRAVSDQARTIRLPVHMIELVNRLNKTARELHQEYGHEPTTAEIGERLGMEPEKVRDIFSMAMFPVSLETPVGDDENSILADMIADTSTRPTAELAEEEALSDMLEDALRKHLTTRQAQVLRMRFGLEDGVIYTLGQVGENLDISRERARQIESEAIRTLRKTIPFMRKFKVYVDKDESLD